MPGRQSTFSAAPKKPKPKKQTKKRSLNALAIAEQQDPRKVKIRRNRLGEAEPDNTKRKRDASDDDNGDAPQKSKRPRPGDKDRFGNEIEGGSDSEGGEWVTGQVGSDDDSDLDSDEAMGDSDEEPFGRFTFRGSSSATANKRWKSAAKPLAEGEASDADINLGEPNHGLGDSDEESDGFREEAVDLVTILDESDDEQMRQKSERKGQESGSEDESSESNEEDFSDSQDSVLSMSDIDDGTGDIAKLSALQGLVSSITGKDTSSKAHRSHIRDAQEAATPSDYGVNPKRKLTVADLLPTITDPRLKKSLKLMSENPTKLKGRIDGIPQKLEVPLAKRQQDRLDRAAAFEKTKETLNRWTDTVKQNRRAEHLSFPLVDPDALAAKDTKRLLPTTQSKPFTTLESTIQNILIDSGLAPSGGKTQEDQIQEFEELALNKIPIEEVQARRAELRKARELLFREEIRAKRIKKIKSKSYRRVHRRERERNALRESELATAAGVEPMEEEQERNDRRRAEERMGARHRESKWAKGVKDSGRAAWDEDARSGVTEMARREEELRRRMAGKDVHRNENDSYSSSSSSSEDEELSDGEGNPSTRYTRRMSNKLHQLAGDSLAESTDSASGLASMKFMQKAEAARKERNDADIERLRQELAGEDPLDEDEAIETSGRRNYGPKRKQLESTASENPVLRSEFEERTASDDEEETHKIPEAQKEADFVPRDLQNVTQDRTGRGSSHKNHPRRLQGSLVTQNETEPEENPWLSMSFGKRSKRDRRAELSEDVLIDANPDLPSDVSNRTPKPAPAVKTPKLGQTPKSPTPKPKEKPAQMLPTNDDSDADSFTGFSSRSSSPSLTNPPTTQPTNQDLINLAFAGDDVLATFTAEKTLTAVSEGPQTISNALPGWGTWTGEGLTKRDIKANKKAAKSNTTTTAGIEPSKRKDAKLERVIVNEKRVKKNVKYLASQLPHPFETRAQYERALRVPVGPEWTTKEVFQRATMPRVLLKQGVIRAMERPLV